MLGSVKHSLKIITVLDIGDDDNSNIDPSLLVCSTWMVKMVLPSLKMMRTIMIMIKILLTCIAGEIRQIVTFISSMLVLRIWVLLIKHHGEVW